MLSVAFLKSCFLSGQRVPFFKRHSNHLISNKVVLIALALFLEMTLVADKGHPKCSLIHNIQSSFAILRLNSNYLYHAIMRRKKTVLVLPQVILSSSAPRRSAGHLRERRLQAKEQARMSKALGTKQQGRYPRESQGQAARKPRLLERLSQEPSRLNRTQPHPDPHQKTPLRGRFANQNRYFATT